MENKEITPVPQDYGAGKSLTLKQDKFCQEFIKDFNATAAARRAGYSAASAYNTGWETMRKHDVKLKIAELIKESSMKPEEIKKRLSDIARGDLSDFIVTRMVEYTPKVKKTLQGLIDDLRLKIDFEDNYALQVNLVADELEAHMAGQEQRRRKIIRYKLELEQDPGAFRIVDGKTELVEHPELDIVALSRDKESSKIKSFKMTKDGPQVELYAADAALTQLARVYAMFIDKSEVELKNKMENMDMEQLDRLMEMVIANAENPKNKIGNGYIEI